MWCSGSITASRPISCRNQYYFGTLNDPDLWWLSSRARPDHRALPRFRNRSTSYCRLMFTYLYSVFCLTSTLRNCSVGPIFVQQNGWNLVRQWVPSIGWTQIQSAADCLWFQRVSNHECKKSSSWAEKTIGMNVQHDWNEPQISPAYFMNGYW